MIYRASYKSFKKLKRAARSKTASKNARRDDSSYRCSNCRKTAKEVERGKGLNRKQNC